MPSGGTKSGWSVGLKISAMQNWLIGHFSDGWHIHGLHQKILLARDPDYPGFAFGRSCACPRLSRSAKEVCYRPIALDFNLVGGHAAFMR